MRWLIGAWLFCLMGYILTGCSPSSPPTKEKIHNNYHILIEKEYYVCENYYMNKGFGGVAENCYNRGDENIKVKRILNVQNVFQIEEE